MSYLAMKLRKNVYDFLILIYSNFKMVNSAFNLKFQFYILKLFKSEKRFKKRMYKVG